MSSMTDERTTIAELKQMVAQFVAARQWQTFHTPKNLAMALAIEAAELMEHFQWLEPAEAQAVAGDVSKRAAAGEELADVLCYAMAMATALGLDVSQTMADKMRKNVEKYPVDEFRGRYGPDDPRRPG